MPINTFKLVEDTSDCAHEFIVGPQRRLEDKLVGFCDACHREVVVQLDKADERTGKSWLIEYGDAKKPHSLPRLSPGELQESFDDLFPIVEPEAGDTVIFPGGRREKIHSVSNGVVVWQIVPGKPDNMGDRPILVGDLAPSGEPHTWIYKGDTDTTTTKAGKKFT